MQAQLAWVAFRHKLLKLEFMCAGQWLTFRQAQGRVTSGPRATGLVDIGFPGAGVSVVIAAGIGFSIGTTTGITGAGTSIGAGNVSAVR